jgi:hypothetical protein
MPAAIILGIGVGVSAYGQYKAGQQSKKIGDYNASVYEQMAEDAIVRGKDDEQRFRQGVKTLIGSQKAGFAGQNIDVNSGSAVDTQADAAFLGELDALTIRTTAQREAKGYKAQAQSARMGGSLDATKGNFGAASTVLSGASTLLQARYGWGRAA